MEKTDDLKTKLISEEGVAVVREAFNNISNLHIPKLFGVCIHHGFNSENYDFALMLRYWNVTVKPQVLYNCWEGHDQGIGRFKDVSHAEVIGMDFGWRPNDGARSITSRLLSVASIIHSWPRMLNIAKLYKPDLIYSSQQTWDNFSAWYLSRRLSVPQIIHLHYMPGLGGSWIGKYAERRLKSCDHVVAVSEYIRNGVIDYGVDPGRVTVIWNTRSIPSPPDVGVREMIRSELGIPVNAVVVGIVARLEPWKGQDDTIDAYARIAARFPSLYLVIVGGGDYQRELKRKADVSGYSDRIVFTGYRKDVSNILFALDIFSHPSRMEAFGIAVLEASAHGLPVVAYDEGGIREIVVNGETGMLTTPGDIASLSSALARLVCDPSLRRDMGECGRERVKNEFDPEDASIKFAHFLSKYYG